MFQQAFFAHGVTAFLTDLERAFEWLAAKAAIVTREQVVATLFFLSSTVRVQA